MKIMKLYELTGIIIGASLLLWVGYGFFFEGNISKPKYTLKKQSKYYEIRSYSIINTYQVSMSSQNNAFRQLFNAIDGKNSQQQKIPMTAPVIQSNDQMMFVLPDNLNSIPEPTSQAVSINSMGPVDVAVISFNGSAKNAQKKYDELITYLKKDGVTHTTKTFLCQYNSPWVFPLLRKNEVWVVIK